VPANLSNVVGIVAGRFHTLAVRDNGTLRGWGYNIYGQTNIPIGLSNVAMIACGDYHNLALKTNGQVVAWGRDIDGEATVPFGLSNVVSVAAGSQVSFALKADGQVLTWGNFLYPGPPPDATNLVAIAAGSRHILALKANGTVVAWGDDSSGQASPPPPFLLSNVVAIAAGEAHSLALRSDGSVVGWGNNTNGQINVPIRLTNVTTISAGAFHNLATGNRYPVAGTQTVTGHPNHDLTVSLTGTDLDNDLLTFRITSLPAKGTLYQYSGGGPGALITIPGTIVSDSSNRVVFTPTADESGNPYTSFAVKANDGDADSPAASVTVRILLPPSPAFLVPRWNSTGAFELTFNGGTNATYRVWTSTNLADWTELGMAATLSNGWYQFLDSDTNWPQRFYRASAP